MFSVSITIFCTLVSSIKTDGTFFSVAITTPFLAAVAQEVQQRCAQGGAQLVGLCLGLNLGCVASEGMYL